jgi:hypothetical protein
MQRSIKTWASTYAVFLTASILLLLYYDEYFKAAPLPHLALSPFMYGVSQFKMVFLFSYVAFLSIVAFFPMPSIFHDGKFTRYMKIITATSVISGLLASLFGFFYFLRSNQLPLDRPITYYQSEFCSVSFFTHIHTGKTIIYEMLKALHLEDISRYSDAGLVFANKMPVFFTGLLGLSTLLAFLGFSLITPGAVALWGQPGRKIVFFIYAFAGAHILKCMVDGGPLSYDLLPSIMAMHIMSSSNDPISVVETIRRWRLKYLLVSTLFLVVIAAISPEDAIQWAFGLFFFGAIYVMLFAVLTGRPTGKGPRFAIVSACLVVISVYWVKNGLGRIADLYSPIGSNDRILKLVKGEGSPFIVDVTDKVTGVKLDAYFSLHDSPIRNRNVAYIASGEEPYTGFIFILKMFGKISQHELSSDRYMHLDSMKTIEGFGNGAYLVKVSFDPETFPPLWSKNPSSILQNNRYFALTYLNDYFLRRGIADYAIILLYYYKVQ